MPVFYRDKLKILYIHVPKTGGTAIELFFEANGFNTEYLDREGPNTLNPIRNCSPQHMAAETLSKVFKLSAFDYIFMTVRHPVQRLFSEYRMRLAQSIEAGVPIADISAWAARLLRNYDDNPYVLDNHIRPQSEFWVPGCEVFRQEDGYAASWVEKISSRIGFQFPQPAVKAAMKFDAVADAPLVLEESSAAALELFYQRDYSLFGYDTVL